MIDPMMNRLAASDSEGVAEFWPEIVLIMSEIVPTDDLLGGATPTAGRQIGVHHIGTIPISEASDIVVVAIVRPKLTSSTRSSGTFDGQNYSLA